MKKSLISLSLLFAIACSGQTGNEQDSKPLLRNVVAKGSLKECKNPKLVCTQSYPETCYEYCDDGEVCQTIEYCAMSYPVQCFKKCVEPEVPEEECDKTASVTSPEGSTSTVCVGQGVTTPPGAGGGSPPNPPGGEDGSPPNPPGGEDGSPPNPPGGEDGSPPQN